MLDSPDEVRFALISAAITGWLAAVGLRVGAWQCFVARLAAWVLSIAAALALFLAILVASDFTLD